MYFNTTKRLLQVAFSFQLGLCSAHADYFMAKVDLETAKELVSKRAEIAKSFHDNLSLPEEAKLDKATVLDWSDSISPFRSCFHLTLKEFDSSAHLDTTLRPHLETAISKVKFRVLDVEIMKKFMALRLESNYELKDSSCPLTKTGEDALKHFATSTPHVSLFKMMKNDDTDIKGIKTAWKIETVEEQRDKIWATSVKTINDYISKLKKLPKIDSEAIDTTVMNIKTFFYSQAPLSERDKIQKVFADLFYQKFKRYFENTLHIDRSKLVNSDESFMEGYIKVVFLKMKPTTVPLEKETQKSGKEETSPHTHQVIYGTDLDSSSLADIEISNRSNGDAKNNYLLLSQLLDLQNLKEKREFDDEYKYNTSKLKKLKDWLVIQKDLTSAFKNHYIMFSGVESVTKK